jgi:hypothetical protein
MLGPYMTTGLRVYRLPRTADRQAFDGIARELRTHSLTRLCVLDFALTKHIDYRALRQFVRGVRKLESLAQPILLAGLDCYLEVIVSFSLSAEDWGLFLVFGGDFTKTAPGGNGVAEVRRARLREETPRSVETIRSLPAPCPN